MSIIKFFRKKNSCIKRILSDNKGSAMITALVVGIVVFVFCLSMLLVAYTLFAQQSRNQVQLGCKTLAWSTVEELEAELSEENSELSKYLNDKLVEFDQADLEASSSGGDKVNRRVELTLGGTAETAGYDVLVSFEIKGKREIETYVACYKDYGNFNEVQSYTVHRTLELK